MSAKWIEVDIDGKTEKILAQKIKGTLWLNYNGNTYTYKPEASRTSAGKSQSEDPSKIFSPMPGRITKVNVNAGDSVKAGQCVVVMEAMKMEYSLNAEVDAMVDQVLCELESTVSQGDLLVNLKEADG